MKLLELHCDYAQYAAREKAIKKGAEEATEEQRRGVRLENVLVVFTSIESEDNEEVVREAAEEVKKNYREVKAENLLVYPYAHLSSDLAKPPEAVKLLNKFYAACQKFAPKAHKSPFGWYKSFEIKCKGHPLSELSKHISAEAGKKVVLKAAGKGVVEAREVSVEPQKKTEVESVVSESLKQEEKMNSRFYVLTPKGELVEASKFDFSGHENLKKFADYEIHKARVYAQEPPHIKLMKEHDLVNYEPASDSGNLRWLPKGLVIKKLLERAITDLVVDYGAMQVETPIMYDYDHPALKKYLNRFPARQYVVRSDDKEFFLRFAACFGQFLIKHDMNISYKDLPLKMYELTHYSFRREQSGELAGLKRLRCFTMPDMHTVAADLEMAKKEFEKQYYKCAEWNMDLGIPVEVAFRAQKDFFEENKDWYLRMVQKINKPILLEVFDVRYAYFITKFEMNFVDAAGKASGLSTVQIDVENAETYDLAFIDSDGKKKRPVILHASISGAIDRVLYAILEREAMKIAAGKTPSFPLWLAPIQVRIIPITDKQKQYAEEVLKLLNAPPCRIRADVDDRSETLQKKIRDAEHEWIP
ncbi:MAG: threonine--tRNA ligase, partial [Candidatus Norongarragalinales archaeon]